MSNRSPADSIEVPRFCGLPSFMRIDSSQNLKGVDAAVVGIPSDSGAPFRNGSRFGPQAIRAISSMLRPISPYHGGINVFELLNVIDYGDAPVVPGYVEESFQRIENYLMPLVQNQIIPIGLGGDHSVTLPQLRAVAKGSGPVALVHFDSHTDTWESYFAEKKYSAGTPFRRAIEENLILPENSIQIGMRGSLFRDNDISQSIDLGLEVITTDTLFEKGIPAIADHIRARTGGKKIFISFDMDFVDPAAAPGVATPEAGGPTARETLSLIRHLTGLNIVGCDVVEVCPMYDNPGQITALLAATIASELLALIANQFAS